MITFDKILGLEKPYFIALMVVCGILLIAIIFFFLASEFVPSKKRKIVERFGKEPKVLEPGWHLIVPLRDKVVAKVSVAERIFTNSESIGLVAKEGNKYSIKYNLSYKVNDVKKYYYVGDNFLNSFENRVTKVLIEHFSVQVIKTGDELYKGINQELLDKINSKVSELGVEVSDLVFVSIL